MAADGGVGAAQVAWFPGFVQRAEGVGNVLRELRAGGGVDGIGGRKGFEIPELSECADDFFWLGQNGDGVLLEACTRRVTGFELAIEDDGGEGEFLSWQAELGAKEDLGWPAPGQSQRPSNLDPFKLALVKTELEGGVGRRHLSRV